jgi:hypothetical protein
MSAVVKGRVMFVDGSGKPLGGGQVFVYVAGTSNLATTFTEITETVPNENPIQLDASGTCVIFATGSFTFAAYDYLGNPVPGESGPAEGLVSPAMTSVTQANTTSAALGLLGGLPASTPVGFTEQTQGVNTVVANLIAYVAAGDITLTLPLTTGLTTKFAAMFNATFGQITLQPQATDQVQGRGGGVPYVLSTGQSALAMTDSDGNWYLFFAGGATSDLSATTLEGGTSGSSGVYTVPNGAALMEAEGWAGGGAGGYADSTHGGGGGGGGGYFSVAFPATPGQTVSFVVGSGGSATALGGTPTAGGNTELAMPGGSAFASGGLAGGQGSGSNGLGGSGGIAGGSAIGAGGSVVALPGFPGAAGSVLSLGTSTSVLVGGAGGGSVMFGGTVTPLAPGGGFAPGPGPNGPGGAGAGAAGAGSSSSGGTSATGANGAGGFLVLRPRPS